MARWHWLIPPGGAEARRLTAWVTLAAGVPRLPIIDDLLPFAELRFFAPDIYGVLFTSLGLALLATSYRCRLCWQGRLVAALGVVAYSVLAAATFSATSFLINAIFALVLLREVWTVRS